MLQTAILYRFKESDQGTLGIFFNPLVGDLLYSIELPDRDNSPNISRIPPGEYICELVHSPRFGSVYQVKDVEGRSHILIHPANVGGDITKGYKTNLQGCIGLGEKYGKLYNQDAVLISRPAITTLKYVMKGQPFKLIISGV